MHLAVYTRSDLAQTVSKLSEFNSDPSEDHMRAAKHALRYLKGTLDLGIQYSPSDSIIPEGCCDASFNSNPDDASPHLVYEYEVI